MVLLTDSNFLEYSPKLRQTLFHSTFFSFDFEFLGLDTSAISLHDTTEHRYKLLRDNVIKYRPCQLGLSFFKQNSTNGGFQSDCYSIPLFQRFGDNSTNISFPSIRFLRSHNFDLNQVFTDGIEYCTRREFKKFEKAMKKGTALSYLSKDVIIELELLKVMLHEKIHQSEAMLIVRSTEEPLQKPILKLRSGESIDLKLNVYMRKSSLEMCLIVYELSKAFPQFIFNQDKQFTFLKVTNVPEWTTGEANLDSLRMTCLEAFEGIAAIMESAMWSRKVIVGHNSLLDCMYLYHYFFEHLPAKYEDFKERFHKLFPKVIDSKVLAQKLRMELGGIGDSLQKVGDFFGSEKSDPMVPPQLRGVIDGWLVPADDDSDNSYHNAAFDAYVTGEVFLKMAHIYVIQRNKLKNEMIKFKQLLQYLDGAIVNRIPFQLLDIGWCCLSGEDSEGCRPDIISVVRKDRQPIDKTLYQIQERTLEGLMATYQFDMELSKDKMAILLATNTPGSYAFLCEKYSKNGHLIPLDELESGIKWTFEQRQTAWRSHKESLGIIDIVGRQWARRQVDRMERVLAD